MKSGKLKHGVMLLFDKTKFQLVEKEAKSYKNNTDVFASIYSQVYIFVTLKNIDRYGIKKNKHSSSMMCAY